jgi:hypothetical protein
VSDWALGAHVLPPLYCVKDPCLFLQRQPCHGAECGKHSAGSRVLRFLISVYIPCVRTQWFPQGETGRHIMFPPIASRARTYMVYRPRDSTKTPGKESRLSLEKHFILHRVVKGKGRDRSPRTTQGHNALDGGRGIGLERQGGGEDWGDGGPDWSIQAGQYFFNYEYRRTQEEKGKSRGKGTDFLRLLLACRTPVVRLSVPVQCLT